MDVLTHEKTCTGLVRQGVCIGVCSEAELDRLTVYTEGLEGLRLTHKHSMWDPTVSSGTDEEEDKRSRRGRQKVKSPDPILADVKVRVRGDVKVQSLRARDRRN